MSRRKLHRPETIRVGQTIWFVKSVYVGMGTYRFRVSSVMVGSDKTPMPKPYEHAHRMPYWLARAYMESGAAPAAYRSRRVAESICKRLNVERDAWERMPGTHSHGLNLG